MVAGSFLISIATKEYRATAGSSPVIRFLLGMMIMIGALVFLGCPLRMVIRMSAGDLNAWTALAAGLVFGALSQKGRTCFARSVRDIILMRNFDLISIIGGFFAVMLIVNLATGGFKLSFVGQPVAHAQHIWNILGIYVVGFAAVLAGGCPLRQLILAGQGSSDSAVTVLGMFVGAAFCHNFGLAGAAAVVEDGVVTNAGGLGMAGKAAVLLCIAVLFAIGFCVKTEKREGNRSGCWSMKLIPKPMWRNLQRARAEPVRPGQLDRNMKLR